ncbi:hypothetical protein NC651_034192 [Populus alba x Populus x berolinensis]|nr:hypothetical protein NC651_034192 [Populus alba x Populus x berolinensis]
MPLFLGFQNPLSSRKTLRKIVHQVSLLRIVLRKETSIQTYFCINMAARFSQAFRISKVNHLKFNHCQIFLMAFTLIGNFSGCVGKKWRKIDALNRYVQIKRRRHLSFMLLSLHLSYCLCFEREEYEHGLLRGVNIGGMVC